MPRLNFRNALRGELKRSQHARSISAPANNANLPTATTATRPFWLKLLRGPFTLPRRFLVDGLHIKLDQLLAKPDHSPEIIAAIKQLEVLVISNQHSITALEGILVNRLHQLDIKIRGPHHYDSETDAIRLNDGYVLVPKAATTLRILLADAPADGLEPGTAQVIRSILRPGMTAVDVGANVGALTLACARAVGSAGKIYSFEPEPAFFNLLEKTLKLNGITWVELLKVAASNRNGISSFHVSPIGGHSSLYPLPAEESVDETLIDVETCRLDDRLSPGERIDLVKMDVEGAELDVLQGMLQTISANLNIAIIAEFGGSHLAKQGVSPEAWLNAFTSLGLEMFAIDELTGRCHRATLRELLDKTSINLVMTRRASRAYNTLTEIS